MMTLRPGAISPSRSAASIIARPMRSLTLPAGLNDSSLPRIVAPVPSPIRSRTSGVRPIRSVIESAIRAVPGLLVVVLMLRPPR